MICPAHAVDALASMYFLDEIEFGNEDVVVDCGANIGELGVWLTKRHSGIRYHAFEPSDTEFSALQQNIESHHTLSQLGLWDHDGALTFYVATNDADSSLIEPPSFTHTVEVPVARLDTKMSEENCIRLLKVEVEGGEPEVLGGASAVLSRCEYVVVDSSAERGKEQGETTCDVVNILTSQGFRLIRMRHSPRVICLFQRTV